MSVELLNADCMEYLAGLTDKAFDLAIVQWYTSGCQQRSINHAYIKRTANRQGW